MTAEIRGDLVFVRYEINDGYAGKSRPQTVMIPVLDVGVCDDAEEVEALIAAEIEEDIMNKGYRWYKGEPDYEALLRDAQDVPLGS